MALTGFLALSLVANAVLLVPIILSRQLRQCFQKTLAHWRAKAIRPDRVFLGDSLIAGGGAFGSLWDINLGSGGLPTEFVAGSLSSAQAYNPRQIIVMAGVNDILLGIPTERTGRAWEQILSDPRVIAFLLPPTANPARNEAHRTLNAMIRSIAERHGRRVASIEGLAREDGTIRPEFTRDGLHLSPAAYRLWRAELERLG